MDENQQKTTDSAHESVFKPRRVTWKVIAVLFLGTVIVSYMIAWKIVKGPVNLTYRANSLLINGRIEESLEYYEKALSRNPRLKMAWIGKGLCLMYLGRFDEALISYNEALILDPSQALAWQGKGLSNENLGRYDDAIYCYEKGLAIFPDNKTILRLKDNLKKRAPASER